MSVWIIASLAAAFLQNLRFVLQKSLKSRLSTLGVTFSRFIFAAPFAAALVAGLVWFGGYSMPGMTPAFFLYASIGGVAQIVATALLVALFSLRNFAVGIAYSKTETIATVALSAVILGEGMGLLALLAILVTLAGVVLMSGLPRIGNVRAGLFGAPALIGISSGGLFALASIGYRGASLSLEGGGYLIRAALTLAFVTAFQTLIMALWLALREPGQMRAVLGVWRIAIWVGIAGMLGSFGWFIAFTLQHAAYVKAVGQVELVFSVLASWLFFRERITRLEMAGITLIAGGIVLLVLVPG
ncbi:EamA family transporter [Abyssibius alkaniclasticus]|uniref:EamA family transporter n=1 Tax=Abyssibius alkaniclasticus TaxID=2881234 RepID=UPI004057D65E